jgi:hypothetical protein
VREREGGREEGMKREEEEREERMNECFWLKRNSGCLWQETDVCIEKV